MNKGFHKGLTTPPPPRKKSNLASGVFLVTSMLFDSVLEYQIILNYIVIGPIKSVVTTCNNQISISEIHVN